MEGTPQNELVVFQYQETLTSSPELHLWKEGGHSQAVYSFKPQGQSWKNGCSHRIWTDNSLLLPPLHGLDFFAWQLYGFPGAL